MTPPESLTRVRRTTTRRRSSDAAWRQSICDARDAGYSLRVIARAAGISHVRVLQIIREPVEDAA